MAENVLTGLLDGDGHAHGRPIGLALDKAGALLIADDVGNTVWRVSAATSEQPPTRVNVRGCPTAADLASARARSGRHN